ncbi:MAG: hypothetical protein AAF404_14950, partial [Pseudomonadota bacterium]
MNIPPGDVAARRQLAIDIARTAGSRVLELFLPEIAVTQKQDETPLTAADLAANKIIMSELTERLKRLSQDSGVTLFMTLYAAFSTLLYRYSGQED